MSQGPLWRVKSKCFVSSQHEPTYAGTAHTLSTLNLESSQSLFVLVYSAVEGKFHSWIGIRWLNYTSMVGLSLGSEGIAILHTLARAVACLLCLDKPISYHQAQGILPASPEFSKEMLFQNKWSWLWLEVHSTERTMKSETLYNWGPAWSNSIEEKVLQDLMLRTSHTRWYDPQRFTHNALFEIFSNWS